MDDSFDHAGSGKCDGMLLLHANVISCAWPIYRCKQHSIGKRPRAAIQASMAVFCESASNKPWHASSICSSTRSKSLALR